MRSVQATDPQLIKRLNLRELRSSRAALSIVSGSVLLVAIVWLGVELALSVTGNSPLLISPADLVGRTASLGTAATPWILTGAGAAAAIVGLALLAAAILPGTKPRHILENSRSAVVVDSEVLASAVSRAARTAARLAPEQVASRVSRKRVDVTVRPGAGRTVDAQAIREAVEQDMSRYRLRKPLTVALSTGTRGEVGA